MLARSSYPRWTAGSLRRERTVRCRSMTSPRVGGIRCLRSRACACSRSSVRSFRSARSDPPPRRGPTFPHLAPRSLRSMAHTFRRSILSTPHTSGASRSRRAPTLLVRPSYRRRLSTRLRASHLVAESATTSTRPTGRDRSLLGAAFTGVGGDWIVPAVAASDQRRVLGELDRHRRHDGELPDPGGDRPAVRQEGPPSTTPGSSCCRGTRV